MVKRREAALKEEKKREEGYFACRGRICQKRCGGIHYLFPWHDGFIPLARRPYLRKRLAGTCSIRAAMAAMAAYASKWLQWQHTRRNSCVEMAAMAAYASIWLRRNGCRSCTTTFRLHQLILCFPITLIMLASVMPSTMLHCCSAYQLYLCIHE
jgi:hypothetical protein